MIFRFGTFITAVSVMMVFGLRSDEDPDLKPSIQTIRQVGTNGKGSPEAAEAWMILAQTPIEQLPQLLTGMDGATPLARNWIQTAVDACMERAEKNKKPLPIKALEKFLVDTRHDPQARRFVFDCVCQLDKSARDRFLPKMVNDPSPELRREAISRLLDEAEKLYRTEKKTEALTIYRLAFASAREKDQIDKSNSRLKDLGQTIDLAKHLGFLLDWKLLGPFPNVEQAGVDKCYPPEKALNFKEEYDGKEGKVRWKDYLSKDDNGIIDLNDGLGEHLQAVGYAATDFTTKAACDVEVRIACFTVFKLWVNGELALHRADAYTGMQFDHYRTKIRLREGKNTFLFKVCTDVPPPQLPKLWRFQLRVCDADGVAILSTKRPEN
ncbi:hypothetical protein KIH39_23170 [Telmatocola sphagniphila]|uniref:HEAT repeat domain-containing protein n=1 Tax=Telmatocola sphagniphila TaxID=1123043 RepID=A0A8E6B3W6_9BACT|nr:hypothetical protein [Telmatocola sphagniphila]QVL31710.1 hypothetical protein KIH39_23170 [Telmatocola sphagniphila]